MPEVTLANLLDQPWTWLGPTQVSDAESGGYFELRIKELPAFLVAARSSKEALDEAMDALESLLEGYVERNELPPLPARDGVWRTGLRRLQRMMSRAADAATISSGYTATL